MRKYALPLIIARDQSGNLIQARIATIWIVTTDYVRAHHIAREMGLWDFDWEVASDPTIMCGRHVPRSSIVFAYGWNSSKAWEDWTEESFGQQFVR